MAWTIYDKNGNPRNVEWNRYEAKEDGTIVTSTHGYSNVNKWVKPELEYNGEWMGETSVTLNIACAVPIDFEIGDYIIYRGEKFVINYDPSVIKRSSRGTYGEGFVYDNVKFNSLSNELTDVRMLDYVLEDNGIPYSSLPKFDVFCNDVDDLADRLQANTNRYCEANGFAPEDYWIFVTPSDVRTEQRCLDNDDLKEVADELYETYFGQHGGEFAGDEAKVNQYVSIDNMSVWESCKYIKETFGYNFIIRGRAVIIGAIGKSTRNIFLYGKNNGLYEIERTADAEQQIITKLYAYGSNKNLPTRYYANSNKGTYLLGQLMDNAPLVPTLYRIETGVPYYAIEDALQTEDAKVQLKYTVGSTEYYCKATLTSRDDDGPKVTINLEGGTDADNLANVYTNYSYIYVISGVYKDLWPNGLCDGGESPLPEEMNVNALMLPGFPTQSLYDWVEDHDATDCDETTGLATWNGHTAYFSMDAQHPYILSPNYTELGIREGTKYFDGSDGDEEIYPTIKNAPDNVDVIYDADVINDNGIYAEGSAPSSNFDIILPAFDRDFNLSSLLTAETKIEVNEGYCGGRDFEVSEVEEIENGRWRCSCVRHYDENIDKWFPYAQTPPSSSSDDAEQDAPYQIRGSVTPNYTGDHYVLTGIEMTSTYIEWGATKLLDAALTFLEKNDYTRYTYAPKVDEIFMARDRDANGNGSYYYTLKEGDLMRFADSDLNIYDSSIYIDSLRIKEYGNGQIPTYEVTLRNDKLVGSIQRMQEQINSLTIGGGVGRGGGGNGGAATSAAVINAIQTEGSKLFLSKTKDDTAQGSITFTKKPKLPQGFEINGKNVNDLVTTSPWVNGHVGSDEKVLSEKAALEHLLRKDMAETLNYILTMNAGARTSYVESLQFATGDDGYGFQIKEVNGHYTLEIDDIIARRKFQVNVLDVKRTMFSQGRQVLTEANGTINVVVPLDEDGEPIGVTIVGVSNSDQLITVSVSSSSSDEIVDLDDVWSYKIYTLAQDDEKTIFDFWRVGDMAMCKELNVKERTDGTSYTDGDSDDSTYGMTVANHQWHRLVIDHGTETLADGRKYNYVIVSNAHSSGDTSEPVKIAIPVLQSQPESRIYPSRNGYYTLNGNTLMAWSFDGSLANTVPMVGDDYVQYGNVLDPDRRGVTSLSQDSKGGVLYHIKNIGATIDPFDSTPQFTNGNKTLNLGDRVSITADSFYISTQTPNGPETKTVSVYMGEWVSGESTAYANQEWSFNGSKYLCTADGTTADPPSANWILTVSKGDTGTGVPGEDAWVINSEPNAVVLEECLIESGSSYQRDTNNEYYTKTWTAATVQMHLIHGLDDVTSQPYVSFGFDDRSGKHFFYYNKSGGSETIINSNRLLDASISNGVLTITTRASKIDTRPEVVRVVITLKCDITQNGQQKTVYSSITVYLNRMGSYISKTVGDATVEMRKRTRNVVDANGNPLEVATTQYVTSTAEQYKREILQEVDGQLTDYSTIEQTSNMISASVNGITTGLIYDLPSSRTATTYRYSLASETVVLQKGMSYTLSASGAFSDEYGEIYIAISKDNTDAHTITLSNSNSFDSITFVALYDGEYSLSAISSGTVYSGYSVTLNTLILEQDASLVSQSYLKMEADHISMGVEGISNANLLEETDWREKALNLTFNNRGNWNSSTSYNYLDQVNYWDMTWVLLYADSVPSGSDDPYHWSGSNNPWVDKSVYDSMTKLTKWSVSANGRGVWLVPNAYRRMTAVHLKKNGSTTSALTQTISNPIVARETYTMSLYYRAKNNLHLFMTHLIDTSANITDTYGVSGVAIINGHAVALNATDVSTGVTLQANPILPSTNWSWRFISITFIAKSSDSYQFALHGFTANTECEATMLKLEKGASATPWTDMGDVLKKSGIDIYAEKIVATTDNFEVHNSSGTKTFGIDPNGNIEAIGNASFKGNVEATSFISNNGSFVARNSDGNNVFWIDSNGDGWISGMLRAKTIYNSILNLVLVSADFGTGTTFPKTRSYSDIMDRRKQMTNPLPYLTYLPDFLIISTTDKKTGTEANPDPRYYNVTLPSASSCEGKMVEVHLYHRLLVDQSSTAHNVGLRVTFSNYTYPDGLSGETAYYQLEQSHTEAKKARFRILSTGSQWLILDEEGVTLNSTM